MGIRLDVSLFLYLYKKIFWQKYFLKTHNLEVHDPRYEWEPGFNVKDVTIDMQTPGSIDIYHEQVDGSALKLPISLTEALLLTLHSILRLVKGFTPFNSIQLYL